MESREWSQEGNQPKPNGRIDGLRRRAQALYNSQKTEHKQTPIPETSEVVQQEKEHFLQRLLSKNQIKDDTWEGTWEGEINRYIRMYQKKCDLYATKLESVRRQLEESRNQFAQFQVQDSQHQAILNESRQELAEYQLLRGNPQRYQEKLKAIDQREASLNTTLQTIDGQIRSLQDEKKSLDQQIGHITAEIQEKIGDIHGMWKKWRSEKQLKTIDAQIRALTKQRAASETQLQELCHDRQQQDERKFDAAERQRLLAEHWPLSEKPSATDPLTASLAAKLSKVNEAVFDSFTDTLPMVKKSIDQQKAILQAKKVTLDQRMKTLQSKKIDLDQQMKILRAELDKGRSLDKKQKKQNNKNQKDLQSIESELQLINYQQNLLQTQMQLNSVEKKICELREQREHTHQEGDDSQTQTEQNFREQMKGLRKERDDLQAKIELNKIFSNQDISSMRNQLYNLQMTQKDFNRKIGDLQAELNNKSLNQEQMRQYGESHEVLQSAKSELQSLTVQRDLLRTQSQCAAVEQEVVNLEKQRDTLRRLWIRQIRLHKLEKKLQVLRTDQTLLQTELQVQRKMRRPSPKGKELIDLREQQDTIPQKRDILLKELAGRGWFDPHSKVSWQKWSSLCKQYARNWRDWWRMKKKLRTLRSNLAAIQAQMQQVQVPYQTNQERLDAIDRKATDLQERLHPVERALVDLRKKQGNLHLQRQDLQTEIQQKRIFSSKEIWQYLLSQWHLRKVEKKLQTRTTEQESLRAQMQSELITPADKVCMQVKKHAQAYKDMEKILENVRQESAKYSAHLTPEALVSDTPPLTEQTPFADIPRLLTQVQQTQKLVHQTWSSSPELRQCIDTLATSVQQLHDGALATRTALDQHYTSLETYAIKLDGDLEASGDLVNNLIRQIPPQDFNPYYSMDRVHKPFDLKDHKGENLYRSLEDPILPRPPHHLSGQKVGIDFTRPGSCSVKSTIRGLSKIGANIRNKADYDKIAEIIGYPIGEEGGSKAKYMYKAYQYHGFDYIYVKGFTITINDMKRVTDHGDIIDVIIHKDGIGAHSVLVEKVIQTSDGGFNVTFYDPYSDKVETLSYKEFKRFLYGRYTVPANWRE